MDFGRRLAAGALLVFCVSFPAASQTTESTPIPNPVPNPAAVDLNEMRIRTQTIASEMNLGRKVSRRFERGVKLVQDAGVLEYANRIAQNLARNSDARVPITIKVVDSNVVNAISFPGGFLYITRGLILAVDDDAEIAGVVAHEIAHVVGRDGMRNDRRFGGPGLNPVIALPPGPDGMTELEGYLIPIFLGSPRETIADSRGIQYMQKAGYNVGGLVTFLEKMQAKEKNDNSGVFSLFQTHPPTAERIRLIRERVGTIPASSASSTDTTTELKRIQGLLTPSEIDNTDPK